jgi:hypothetical protein
VIFIMAVNLLCGHLVYCRLSSGLQVAVWTAVGLLRGHLVACMFVRVLGDIVRPTGGS